MQRNKVYAVTTVAKVAQDLGETIGLLDDLTGQMDTEDGLIWVYGTDEDPVRALSQDGIECLHGLIAEQPRTGITFAAALNGGVRRCPAFSCSSTKANLEVRSIATSR